MTKARTVTKTHSEENQTFILDHVALKTKIICAWSTVADLEATLFALTEDPSGTLTEAEIATLIAGIKELHNSRMKELMYVYERMIEENIISLDLAVEERKRI